MSYSIGDLVIYGETGVCEVIDTVNKQMVDGERECYKLKPLYQSFTVFTPVENSPVFTRPIISAEEAQRLINNLPVPDPELCSPASPRELNERYDKLIKSHDCELYLLFIVSVLAKHKALSEQKKKLSAIEERFLKKAQDLLFGELAAASGREKSEIITKIKSLEP